MNSNIVLPGFEEVIVKNTELIEDKYCFYVEMPIKEHQCPKCRALTLKIHDYRTQKIKHLKIFERQTVILYKKRRFTCVCGKRFAENNPFIERYQPFRLNVIKQSRFVVLKGKHLKKQLRFMEPLLLPLYAVLMSYLKVSFKRNRMNCQRLSQLMSTKGIQKRENYQLIIADAVTREPIDILPNRYKKTIKHYLSKYGTHVKYVVMNMSPSFKAAVQQALDKPVIIADRFHFVRYIYWGTRRRIQSIWHDYDRKNVRKSVMYSIDAQKS